ncbi:MAG: glycosyl hydrolase [Crocinitomicaceae bacterium]|nr:glycosyl hydrolase [Crocinitomicaceae bacterium]
MKYILFFLAVVSCSLRLTAQSPYPLVKIDEGDEFRGPEEPSIAISRKDTSIVVAGANIKKVYASQNGGRSWEKQQLESQYGVWGDPCVVAAPNGRFYFFHLSDPTGKNWASDEILDRIVCQQSNKKGTKWSKGSYAGLNGAKDQDKEWAVIDPNTGTIYVTWTQFDKYDSKKPEDKSNILFSKSTNKGRSWSTPVRINEFSGDCLDDDKTVEGAVPAVGPNGELYVAWSYDEKIYFDYSLDGGETWQEKDIVISVQPGGWNQNIPGINRTNGMPVTICDLSEGLNKGTVYVNWTDQRKGTNNTDVWVAKSTDGGKSWSQPIRVNDDETETHQFLTWMTVDQTTGNLYAVFYDRRAYVDAQTDVYLATSTDGGETWVNEKISAQPFKPVSSVFFGDYNNIDAYQGMVRPVWTEYRDGKLSIWTAIIQK